MKQRKILRDSIVGITKSALQRIAYTAGITSMSSVVYEELRGFLKAKMEKILNKAIVYTEYQRKMTIDEYAIAANISPKIWSMNPKAKACKLRKSKRNSRSKSRSKSKNKKSANYNALLNIRYYQKLYDCLNIPMASFERLSREIASNFKCDVRFTKKALIIFQYSMEKYLLEILKKTLLLTVHANRTRIEPKDIILATKKIQRDF